MSIQKTQVEKNRPAEKGDLQSAPVFQDFHHRRRAVFRILSVLFAVSIAGWLATFAASLYYVGKLPSPAILTPDTLVDTNSGTQFAAPVAGNKEMAEACGSAYSRTAATAFVPPAYRPTIYAHLFGATDAATASLGRACGAVDVLLAEWYSIYLPEQDMTSLAPPVAGVSKIRNRLDTEGTPADILPVLNVSYANARKIRADFLDDPEVSKGLIDTAERIVTDDGYRGLCINLFDSAGGELKSFRDFFVQLSDRLSSIGRQTCVVVDADGPLWRDEQILAAADLVVFRAFGQPSASNAPGPIAPQPWFERIVSEALDKVGADRLVIALGSFGYDWVAGRGEPEPIGFAEAMRRAARYNGQIELAPNVLNTTVQFTDAEGKRHEIWLLDAVSIHNQRVVLERLRPHGVALWSFGTEDPGVWTALNLESPDSLKRMETIILKDYVGYEGNGSFLHILHVDEAGHRSLSLDSTSGLIVEQAYTSIPQPYSIERLGAGADGMVALTFDDGPDASYTPEILDVLQARSVPATFFVIGSNVMRDPDIVRRMVAEGHEIGSHTFFHPDIEVISDIRIELELNSLQRLIVSVTGRNTRLFRTPYGRSEGPVTAAESRPFLAIQQSGYLAVGANAVPRDWEGIGPQAIIASTRSELLPAGGNVIVMHDGGGDRSATVAALPLLIDDLRARGYRFVSLATMLGMNRDVLMPVASGLVAVLDGYSFAFLGLLGDAFRFIFWIAIILGTVRSLVILALAHLRRHYPVRDTPLTPTVTAVIPAFDEEDVILESIGTILASDYPIDRLIVVDDGSTDHTYQRVAAAYADDPRVLLIREPNQGKWMALDTAYAHIETEVVVAIDADTIIQPDAIRKLVGAFQDPRVGAVAGKVKVGNGGKLLTNLQALEYVTAQNIDRRAAEMYGGILVVPGAIGAWRTAAVRKAGLYTGETVTEDADLTVSVLRAGYRVVFEEDAISTTEAPNTIHAFMKQRLRWTFGMLQIAWKHRRAGYEGRPVGLISIPDLWLFGVGLALIAPIADLVFLGAILDVLIDIVLSRPLFQSPSSPWILVGYLLLPAIDVLSALLAFRFERKLPALVLLIPLQRFFYRQLLYITVYRAVWRALTGKIVDWGKLARLGLKRLPEG